MVCVGLLRNLGGKHGLREKFLHLHRAYQCDDGGLHVEEVRVDLKEGEEVLRRLEEGGPEVDVEVVGHELEQLVHVQRTSSVHRLPEELDELVRHHRVDPVLLRLPEGGGDLALVLLQEDDLLLHHELLRVAREEVFKLLDMLPRDVTDLQNFK